MLARQFSSHLTRGNIAGLHVEAAAFLYPKTQAQSDRGLCLVMEHPHGEVLAGNSTTEVCVWVWLLASSLFKKKKKISFFIYLKEYEEHERFKACLNCFPFLGDS